MLLRRSSAWGVSLWAAAVVLAACGGSEATTATVTPAVDGTAPTAAPTPASPAATASAPAPTAAAAAPMPSISPSAQTGTLEVRVTDAPPDGVSKILLTVRNIEVNGAQGDTESGWRTVVEGPVTFDLVAVTGVEEALGSAELPPGRYNQVRLEIVTALVTTEGEEKPTTVPSGKLRLVGGFDVVAGETLVLTLDFDAGKSVVLRGRGDPLLKPTVKLLVRKSGQSLEAAAEIAEVGEEASAPETPSTSPGGPSPSPIAVATEAPTPIPTTVSVPTETAVAAGPPREITIVQTNFQFTPNVVTVNPGETVIFTVVNMGGIFHTFTLAFEDVAIDLELLGGETKSTGPLTFPTGGMGVVEIGWHCRPHQAIGMTGTIQVDES